MFFSMLLRGGKVLVLKTMRKHLLLASCVSCFLQHPNGNKYIYMFGSKRQKIRRGKQDYVDKLFSFFSF